MGDEDDSAAPLANQEPPEQPRPPPRSRLSATAVEVAIRPADGTSPRQWNLGSVQVVLVGGSGSGKSEIVDCLKRGGRAHRDPEQAALSASRATVGVDFWHCVWERGASCVVKLVLFDAPGKDVFEGVARSYLQRSRVCVVACDLKSDSGLMTARMWADKAYQARGTRAGLVLVGTKDDALGKVAARCISPESLIALGREVQADHVFQVSALEGQGVLELFDRIVSDRLQANREALARGKKNAKTTVRNHKTYSLTDEYDTEDDANAKAGSITVEEDCCHGESRRCRCTCKYTPCCVCLYTRVFLSGSGRAVRLQDRQEEPPVGDGKDDRVDRKLQGGALRDAAPGAHAEPAQRRQAHQHQQVRQRQDEPIRRDGRRCAAGRVLGGPAQEGQDQVAIGQRKQAEVDEAVQDRLLDRRDVAVVDLSQLPAREGVLFRHSDASDEGLREGREDRGLYGDHRRTPRGSV